MATPRVPEQGPADACAVAIVVAIALYLTLEYTRLGRRCVPRRQPDAATYMGIDVSRLPHRLGVAAHHGHCAG